LYLKKILTTILIVLLCHLLWSQDPFYINYDTKDGLPSSEVYTVEVDKKGMIWFSTDRGICSYDGYQFKTYTTRDGLANNTSFHIYRSPKGRLLFGGMDGALTILDEEGFHPFQYNEELITACGGKWIIEMKFIDENQVQFIREKENERKVFTMNLYTGEIKSNIAKEVRQLSTINDRRGNTVHLVENNNREYLYSMGGLSHREVKSLDDDRLATRWQNRLYIKEGGQYRKMELPGDPYIDFLYRDDKNDLWVCSAKGLLRFEGFDFSKPPSKYFEGKFISSILADREGNYWVTTLEEGVLFVPSFGTFEGVDFYANKEKKVVRAIGAFPNHMIFSGEHGSLYQIDTTLTTKTIIPFLETKYRQWPDINVDGTEGYCCEYKFSETGKGLEKTPMGRAGGLITLKLNDSLELLTGGVGYSLQINKKDVVKFDKTVLAGKRIVTALKDSQQVWLGTFDGLYQVDIKDIAHAYPVSEKYKLPSVRINDLEKSSANHYWLATMGEGLFFFTEDTTIQLTIQSGLNSDLINKIYIENDSTLWVGTNRGLNKLTYHFVDQELRIREIINLTTADGLPSNFINDLVSWQKKIWLATNKGLYQFDQNIQVNKKSRIAPLINLEEVLVDGKNIRNDDQLVLSYDQDELQFNYTGISFKKPESQPFYRYSLSTKESKKEWYYTNDRSVRFTNLTPGKYTFQVEARNKYGVWSENKANYSFTLPPHFTRQLWFQLLAGLTLLGLIYWIINNRSQAIQSKEEQKRQLQEAELKTKDAELLALRNQMNPHFVFNALNSIQNFIYKNDVDQANYYLAKFSRLMRDSLEFSKLEYISLNDELKFLQAYLDLEKMRYPEKFEYRIELDPDIPKIKYFIPPLLVQPLLENAVKHGLKNKRKNGLIEIFISEEVVARQLKIVICDNGSGVDDLENLLVKNGNGTHKSYGLNIIKNRIDLLNTTSDEIHASFRAINRSELDAQLNGLRIELILPIKLTSDD